MANGYMDKLQIITYLRNSFRIVMDVEYDFVYYYSKYYIIELCRVKTSNKKLLELKI